MEKYYRWICVYGGKSIIKQICKTVDQYSWNFVLFSTCNIFRNCRHNRFPNHEHLCSYAILVPKIYQSGEKLQLCGASKRGRQMLRGIIMQCMHVHVRRCPDSTITRHYERISARRGKSKGKITAARKMAKIIYVMLKENKSFRYDG